MVTITDILNQWADIGVFAYVLPFLMIFAVVYGILAKTGIFGKNKGVDATIALAMGLLALQFDLVPNFFATLFPMAGIGLAVLLVAVILIGLYSDTDKDLFNRILMGLGGLIFVVVVLTSVWDFRWWGGWGYGWENSLPTILIVGVVLGLIGWIVVKSGGDKRVVRSFFI